MYKLFVLLFFATLVLGCNTSDNKKEANPELSTPTERIAYLPSITEEELKILWDNSNQVDYIYYDLPISTSLSDVYSIQQSLRHVSEAPVPLDVKNKCKAISRVFYKSSGKDLMEAEIYFSQGCTFFVFFKEGKPAYSNLMTNDGIKHFNQIVAKAREFQPK